MNDPLFIPPISSETPLSQAEMPTRARSENRTRVVGWVTLALLFLVSITLTTTYLSAAAEPRVIQTAAVESSTTTRPDPFAGISLIAQSAYVYDLAQRRVLYELNPDVQLPLASMTKVATVLAVSEVLDPAGSITIPYDTAPPGSVERLAKGSVWRTRDVIDFTLIASSNNGADILAAAAEPALHAKYPQAADGSATLWRMNDLAKQLNLRNTYFLNDSGLDLSATLAGSYGSARDIATLFAYAATSSRAIFEGTTRSDMTFTSLDGQRTTAFNTNLALDSIPGIMMGKTGFTDLAGGNLGIVFYIAPGHPVVAVVMHSTENGRFEDIKQLVAAASRTVRDEELPN